MILCLRSGPVESLTGFRLLPSLKSMQSWRGAAAYLERPALHLSCWRFHASLYRELGFHGFNAYARERLGISPSRARALRPGSIDRYVGPFDHWVTREVPTLTYYFEASLGYYRAAATDGTTVNVYSCRTGSNHFITLDPHFEGQTVLRFEGSLRHPAQPKSIGTRAIYRCKIAGAGDHIASNDSQCEGQIETWLLGYACRDRGSC